MASKSCRAPELKLPLECSINESSAPVRRPSQSARLSKASLKEKGMAMDQLAEAAEAIRRQRDSTYFSSREVNSDVGGASGSDNSMLPSRPPPSRTGGHMRKRSLSMSELPDAMKRNVMRQKVAEELRSTEESYVRDLELVKTRVIDPLDKREILTKEARLTLFSNLRQLLDLHLHLLEDLRKTEKPWEPFAKMSAFFKLYITYSTTHGAASQLAAQLYKTNPAFAALVGDALSCTEQKLRLEDYLIKPIQRICKYPLLFQELQRHTDAPHCIAIGEVAKKMSEVAEIVNAAQRRSDSTPRLLEIAQSFDPNGKASFTELIAPEHQFVREQTCDVVMEDGDAERLVVLLFSDMVLLTRPPSVLRKKYELRQEIQLNGAVRALTVDGAKPGLAIADDKRTLFIMRGLGATESKEWAKEIAQVASKLSCSPRLLRM